VLLNQAPHGIDIFVWLGGLPSRVFAKTGTRRHAIEVEDEASALLEYPDGAIGFYHTNVNEAPGGGHMELCGENGKLVIGRGGMTVHALDTPVQQFSDETDQMWGRPETHEEEVPLEERETGHGAILRNFVGAILRDEPLLAPGVEGIRSLEFINAVILSGAKGKPVDIPVDREEYEAFIEEKKRTSTGKKRVRKEERITDPNLK